MEYPRSMQVKEQIRKVMIDHLKSKGYPNMTADQIMAELKPMWLKLEDAGLIKKGWRYGQYVEIAQAQAHYQNLKDTLESELLKHFSRKP